MATNTMDAIKKKMQAMKGEKDNALEKADQLEQRVSEQKAINEKVRYFCFVLMFVSSAYLTFCAGRPHIIRFGLGVGAKAP